MRDFNVKESNIFINDFCELKNLNRVSTCFKNLDNPKTTDLMLARSVCTFQNSCALETGLSDLHEMTFTVPQS